MSDIFERARLAARRGYMRHLLSDGIRRLPGLAMKVDILSGVRAKGDAAEGQREAAAALAADFIEQCEVHRLAWDDLPDFLFDELFPEVKTAKRVGARTDTGYTGDILAVCSEETGRSGDEGASSEVPPRFAAMNLSLSKADRDFLAKNPPKKASR